MMKKKIVLWISCFLLMTVAGSQIYTQKAYAEDEINISSSASIPKDTIPYNGEDIEESIIIDVYPTAQDIEYMNRLATLQQTVPLDYNQYTLRYIDVYTQEKADKLSKILAEEDKYFPLIERVFLQYGIPLEMKYLSVIESALNPNAISRSGAGGLWQFMPATGRLFGLKQDSWVDERRDPYKSTVAAAQYLNELYGYFHDWHIVMASYNCGPGCLQRVMQRTGLNNYWDLRPHLKSETAGYVPAYIGVMYAMNYYASHGIQKAYNPYHYDGGDTVTTYKKISFNSIAKYVGMSEEYISYMNPELIKDCTPPYPWHIRLTPEAKSLFYTYYDSIVGYIPLVIIDTNIIIAKKTIREDAFYTAKPKGTTSVNHKVNKGETLNKIAHQYAVTTDAIMKWNGMEDDNILLGEVLKIYTKNKPTNKNNTYTVKKGDNISEIAARHHISISELKKLNGLKSDNIKIGATLKVKSSNRNNNNTASNSRAKPKVKNITYTVKKGDTLNIIAKKNDMTLAELKKLNGLISNNINPGDKLKVN